MPTTTARSCGPRKKPYACLLVRRAFAAVPCRIAFCAVLPLLSVDSVPALPCPSTFSLPTSPLPPPIPSLPGPRRVGLPPFQVRARSRAGRVGLARNRRVGAASFGDGAYLALSRASAARRAPAQCGVERHPLPYATLPAPLSLLALAYRALTPPLVRSGATRAHHGALPGQGWVPWRALAARLSRVCCTQASFYCLKPSGGYPARSPRHGKQRRERKTGSSSTAKCASGAPHRSGYGAALPLNALLPFPTAPLLLSSHSSPIRRRGCLSAHTAQVRHRRTAARRPNTRAA